MHSHEIGEHIIISPSTSRMLSFTPHFLPLTTNTAKSSSPSLFTLFQYFPWMKKLHTHHHLILKDNLKCSQCSLK